MKRILHFIFFFLCISCIEPYQFRIHDNEPTLVIEASISDKSFTETLDYPSDGRHFTVRLSKTGDVINIRPEMISGASVQLINDLGEQWEYQESNTSVGVYVLPSDDFKALKNLKYKLLIDLSDGDKYESTWEQLPGAEVPLMGDIHFEETEIRGQAGVITKGIMPNISVPQNTTGQTLFYRWRFTPTWIYIAPLAATTGTNNRRTCWATSPYYIRNYTLHQDDEGGYKKDFFFMPVEVNERIEEEFSLLIEQQSMTEDSYYFWKEMQELNQDGFIFDSPPYNLKTNFTALNSEKKVSGYFGVVSEQAARWYFNVYDLSYRVENTRYEDCSTPCGPGCPPPSCVDCRRYEGGESTNVRPVWWGR